MTSALWQSFTSRGRAARALRGRPLLDGLAKLAGRGDQCPLVDVGLGDLRMFSALAFAGARGVSDPFTRTVKQLLEERSLPYEDSALKRYYDEFQPRTVAEVLGLDEDPARPWLSGPPLTYALPWDAAPGPVAMRRRLALNARENREHGAAYLPSAEWKFFGPVSDAKGRLEFERLRLCHESIERNGYRRQGGRDGDITGVVFRGETTSAVRVVRGQHRIAVLNAHGYAAVPLRLNLKKTVHRGAVRSWPAVRRGALSTAQALRVFDRFLDGEPPAALKRSWLEEYGRPNVLQREGGRAR